LFAREGIDLKPYLLCGDDDLRDILQQIVSKKPARHDLSTAQSVDVPFSMAQIGG
jgi:molybdenum cofactor biosynthesis enzyme MoaA